MDSPQPFLIHGMVEDVLGQPIADAWVGLHALERDEVLAESRTDAAGRFSMQVAASLMECDVGRLVAKAAGRAKGVAYANGHDNVQPIVRIVLPESCELRGRVTDEAGAPLAQVELIARHVGHLGDTVLACTDNEGRFVFDAVPIGRVLVTAWQRGRQLVHVEQDTCTDAPLELRLVPAHGRTIRFRILGASKQQLAQATCRIQEIDPRLADSWCIGQPDEDGVWELSGLPNEWAFNSLHVSIPGMRSEPRYTYCPAHPKSGRYEFEFTMHEQVARQVRGRVLTEDGTPVAGARLRVRANYETDRSVETAADGSFVVSTVTPDGENLHFTLSQGEFVLNGPGDVDWPSPLHRRSHIVELPGPQELTLRAVPAASLRGRCTLSDGTPCSGVLVHLKVPWRNEHGEHESYLGQAVTDEEGWFVFQNQNARLGGPVRVQAVWCRTGGHADPVQLQEGAVVELPPLVLPMPASVTGVLRDVAGRPIPGEPIRWEREGEDEVEPDDIPYGMWVRAIADAFTTREGRFLLTEVPAGRGRLASCGRRGTAAFRSDAFEVREGEVLARGLVSKNRVAKNPAAT